MDIWKFGFIENFDFQKFRLSKFSFLKILDFRKINGPYTSFYVGSEFFNFKNTKKCSSCEKILSRSITTAPLNELFFRILKITKILKFSKPYLPDLRRRGCRSYIPATCMEYRLLVYQATWCCNVVSKINKLYCSYSLYCIASVIHTEYRQMYIFLRR